MAEPAPDEPALDRPALIWSSRPARAEAAVVVTADANAFPYAAFLAARLAKLEPEADHDLVVLLTDGSRPDPGRLPEARLGGMRDGGLLEGLPVTRSIPRATYSRLLLPQVLPEYRRLLYLDADMMPLRAGVGALLAAPAPATVSAAPDFAAWIAHELPGPAAIWRNAGVQLIDAARARAEGTVQRILAFAHANPARLKQHDQSALNLALAGELGLLSPRWNWMDLPQAAPGAVALEPVLLHFVGHPKPWDWTPGHPRMEWFDAYAAFLAERFGIPLRREAESAGWTRVNAANRVHRWPLRERLDLWLRRRRFRAKDRKAGPPPGLPGGRLQALHQMADL